MAERTGIVNHLAVALALAAAVCGVATYTALTGTAPFGPSPTSVLVLLNIDLVLLLALGALVARRIVQLWSDRRRGSAGSKLHVRMVVLFSLVAAAPAIVVAIFSALFFDLGIEAWFSDKVRTAVEESLAVAESYLKEHQQVIRGDILAMANDINRDGPMVVGNQRAFNELIDSQAALRSLTDAVVFDQSGRVLGRSRFSFVMEFDPVPPEALERARNGEVVVFVSKGDNRVRALVRLETLPNAYLYVARFVEARVLQHMQRTQEAVSSYKNLEQRRSSLQITFAMIFIVVALLLLLAAVWLGLALANTLARPIMNLMSAAERVREGDLTARVPETPSGDEFGSLSRAFNRMTSQLETQRRELIEANGQLDFRRRFIEAVLGGVSAGVIGLDADGRINYPNRTASVLAGVDLDAHMGEPLAGVVPELGELIASARTRPGRLRETQIEIAREGRSRALLVRVFVERDSQAIRGFVVTYDDVTDLMSAQRMAAWADVARRLAHEIKNPLTPIQLSAERLRRRYLPEIKSDPNTFAACVDTIVRHVEDIGGMISEFSAFARMPAPEKHVYDLGEIVGRVVLLQRSANSEIAYSVDMPSQPVKIACDDRQTSQALTNLLQNAADSLHARLARNPDPQGEIHVRVEDLEDSVAVVVEDNGLGLPRENRERLTEPYVTTRAEGTGLGLAIVKKIMEDHGGSLELNDRKPQGASVTLIFPKGESNTANEAMESAPENAGAAVVRTHSRS
ncbi:MAG TPA: PAS domain-containing sensor histidine kinase [Alphaproteobacteria bacterium]|nr:PAS domain-containing sensor histidine kinase [Alphaproteobacteria bacterium]